MSVIEKIKSLRMLIQPKLQIKIAYASKAKVTLSKPRIRIFKPSVVRMKIPNKDIKSHLF
jgi:hypothetical protein